MALNDVIGNLPQFIQAFEGISLVNEGASMSVAGAKYNAELYRMAGNTSIDAAKYNIGIERINRDRQLDAMAREVSTINAKNRAVVAASGISFASKSYLAIQNRVLSDTERKVAQFINTSKQKENQMLWEGQVAQVRAENQARGAEYAGQVAQYQANLQNSKNISGLVSDAFSTFLG